MATDQQLVELYGWTLHRRWASETWTKPGSPPPCTCEFCMKLRRDRWEAEHGKDS